MVGAVQTIISDEVLDKVMRLFWEKGFFNTSIDDIVGVTGFNRAAIYKYFGGKRNLFLEMLKRYRQDVTPKLTEPLSDTSLGITAIANFFNQFQESDKPNVPRGCFLIATASNLPSHDDEIAEFIHTFSKDLYQLFFTLLGSAIESKQIAGTTNKKAIADFLVVNVFGLMTLHRMAASSSSIKNHLMIVEQFLRSITQEANI